MIFDPPLESIYKHDEVVKATFPVFVKHLNNAAISLRENIALERWKEIEKISHKAKGSAGSYGYPDLVTILNIMENEARLQKRPELLLKRLENLEIYIRRISASSQ